jgi:hypothetical protein
MINSNNTNDIIWAGGANTTTGPITNNSQPLQQQGQIGSFYYNQPNYNIVPLISYFLLKLPEPHNIQPEEVFWNGRNLTLGVIGSRAEAAFMGIHLIFDSQVTNAISFGHGFKLILKYPKKIYHYHIESDFGYPRTKPDTKLIDAQVLSTIERD